MAGRGRRARLTGRGYLEVLPKTLDTLIHERGVPAMVAIMIYSGGGDSKGSQRDSDTAGSPSSSAAPPALSTEKPSSARAASCSPGAQIGGASSMMA